MALYDIPVLKVTGGQQTREQICARIENMDLIIGKIETAMLSDSAGSAIVEYELDTGQTRQRVKLSTSKELAETLDKIQLMRDRLAAKLDPKVVRLIPNRSLRNNF